MNASPLEILHADDHLVAIDKPPGLLTHRSAVDRHESRFALQMLRDQLGRRVYPVHRLDKPTSGVLVFALTPAGARDLATQFASRRVEKHYLAVLRGHCAEQGVVDHPLREQADPATDRRTRSDKPAQAAVTEYRRLARVELPVAVDRYPQSRYCLAHLQPGTGRRHQLRRHMKHIAHPIIGDSTHGKGVHNRFFAREYGCARLLLACVALGLAHPGTGRRMRLVTGPGEDFLRVLEAFGWLEAYGDLHDRLAT